MKRLISAIALVVILCTGIFSVVYLYRYVPISYDGTKTDVYGLMQDPANYDTTGAEGIADVIVKQNLDKTNTVNDVTSIVFDFRGYDTMGEAFILVVAVTGAAVILRKPLARKEDDQ
jgi:hypothetical protein